MKPRGTTPFAHTGARQYTLQDGLAGMLVEDIYQDRRGLLWIATADGGVSRFDGETFESFQLSDGLPHLTVMTIAEDAEGRLWFGTLGGGLAAFDGRGFQVYTTEHGLPSDEILVLQPQADGSMGVLTGAGICRFADGECVDCTTETGGRPIGRVHDMVTDSTGTTWLATRDRGIISLDGRCLSPVFDKGGVHHWAWKLALDSSGHLWIASRHGKEGALVGRYDPRSQHLDWIEVSAPLEVAQIVTPGIRHVRLDDKGWLWIARRGVLVYDGQEWHPFSARFADADFQNTRLTYEDRDGNIWVGSYGGGLVFCQVDRVRRYTQADGLPHHRVRSLAEDPAGRIWIGTGRGVACLQGEKIHSMGTSRAISALAVDRRGVLWAGDWGGRVYRGGSTDLEEIAVLAEDAEDRIAGLCVDPTGRLWVGTSHGRLGYMEQDRFVPLLSLDCRAMVQGSEGVLWIGTAGGSPVLHYMDRAHRLHAWDPGGLEGVSKVGSVCEHEGLLWAGTVGGLCSVDPQSRKVRRYTTEQGLPANSILSLGTDRQGRLWIGTRGGVALKHHGGAFHSLHLGESTLEREVNAVLSDSQGRLWFGTGCGLTMYRPPPVPPGIVIRQSVEGRLLEAPEAVSFPRDAAEIEIHFQGIRFGIDRGPMLYSHRLAGHGPEGEWSEFTPAGRASYHDLPVGEYRFEVRTCDPEGMASEAAQLQVRVVPGTDSETHRGPDPERQFPADRVSDHSPTIAGILSQLRRVAEADMTVLLRGETGTGKGLVAREIHELSPRRRQALVHVNCGSLTSALVESELFGHEQGAFTGAVRRKIGLFEQAHGGTLFLDEIGDLPSAGQQALLHILEDGLLRRVGGTKSVAVDVRVIAATNRDLEKMVREETFRSDLYYRLGAFPVVVPPLRDRREEIPALAAHFAAEYARQVSSPLPTLSEEALGYLQQRSWPGNVRQLEHLMRRAVMLCEGETMEVTHVSLTAEEEKGEPQRAEKEQIMEALEATKGRIYGEHGAAKLLGMNPERLRSRMRSHGLVRAKKPSKPREGGDPV